MVDLEADAVGVFEQHRVVSGRPGTFFGRMDNLRAQFAGKLTDRINVLASTRAEAYVMQSRPSLCERYIAKLRFGARDAEVGGLPVLDSGKLVGIVTTIDMLRAFLDVVETFERTRSA